MPIKIKKATLSVTKSTIFVKNFVTRKARIQLKETAREEACPLISGEKSSDIISQGIGPKPMEKANMKRDMETTGKAPSFSASSELFSFCDMKKKAPRPAAEAAMIDEEEHKRILLSVLSMMNAPKKVDTT